MRPLVMPSAPLLGLLGGPTPLSLGAGACEHKDAETVLLCWVCKLECLESQPQSFRGLDSLIEHGLLERVCEMLPALEAPYSCSSKIRFCRSVCLAIIESA